MQEPAEALTIRDDDEDEEEEEAADKEASGGQDSEASLILLMSTDEEGGEPLDTSGRRNSTASPEELEDEENSGDNESVVPRSCTYPGCQETTSQQVKQRKPWMCKKHRNKMYKDKYKNKKKSDQSAVSAAVTAKLEDNTECSVSLTKQRAGSVGDRPPRPSLLEQVLNQKRLSLLRSPEVVQFLQTQQQLLSRQAFEQRQSFQGVSL
ncbi:regulatory factor X-associated protein [Gastrophryne carolinensis]